MTFVRLSLRRALRGLRAPWPALATPALLGGVVPALLGAAVPALLVGAVPAWAETPVQLEALSRATDSSASGLALARRQIANGELLDALATLERLIVNDPGNYQARLLHAGLLCRVDDPQGSLIEFDALRGHDFPPAQWAEAMAPCDAAKDR